MSLTATEAGRTAAERVIRACANGTELSVFLDYANLPKPVTKPVARPEAVYVTVANEDDLAQWMVALGGEIHVSTAFGGFKTWVLYTKLRTSDRRELPVRVAVPIAADEFVRDDLTAVSAA